jgi:hypothetical protein
MARLETLAWRHYYEKRYLPLFTDLYEMSRREQGYSPLDSVRLAVAAARAAKAFQPSTSRAQAEVAISYLIDYFRILARGAPVQVDVEDAARTELAWWQARREAVPPEQYGAIIARVTTLLYGADGEDVRRSAVIRAQGDGLPRCACRQHDRRRLGRNRGAVAVGIPLAQKGGIFT